MRQFPFEPGPARRPPGRGAGLEGPECPVRAKLDQNSPPGCRPCQRMCIRCGRVTSRGDGDGVAWCGGVRPSRWMFAGEQLVPFSRRGGCIWPTARTTVWMYRNDLEGPAATETPLEAA